MVVDVPTIPKFVLGNGGGTGVNNLWLWMSRQFRNLFWEMEGVHWGKAQRLGNAQRPGKAQRPENAQRPGNEQRPRNARKPENDRSLHGFNYSNQFWFDS